MRRTRAHQGESRRMPQSTVLPPSRRVPVDLEDARDVCPFRAPITPAGEPVSVTASPSRLLLIYKPGELGNRLVQSAPAMALARELGIPLYNLALDEYAGLFEGSRHDVLSRFPARRSLVPPTPLL